MQREWQERLHNLRRRSASRSRRQRSVQLSSARINLRAARSVLPKRILPLVGTRKPRGTSCGFWSEGDNDNDKAFM